MEGDSLAPFWPQRLPCPCSVLRELAKGFGEVVYSKLTFLPDLFDYLQVRCPCFLEPKKKKKKREMPEGKNVDVETTMNTTPTKADG